MPDVPDVPVLPPAFVVPLLLPFVVPLVRVPVVGAPPRSFAVVLFAPVPRVEAPPAGMLLLVVPVAAPVPVVPLPVVPLPVVLLRVVPLPFVPLPVVLLPVVLLPVVPLPVVPLLVVPLPVVPLPVVPLPVVPPGVELPDVVLLPLAVLLGVGVLDTVLLVVAPPVVVLVAAADFFGGVRRALPLLSDPAFPPVSTSTSPSDTETGAGSLLREPPDSLRTPDTICSYFSRPARLPST